MHVGRDAWCVFVCVYVYMFVLISKLMEADMHEYVGVYMYCMYV